MARKGLILGHTVSSTSSVNSSTSNKGNRKIYTGQHVTLGFNIPPATSNVIEKLHIGMAHSEVASGQSEAAASRQEKMRH